MPFTEVVVVPSSSATSAARHCTTSRRISTARCRAGRYCKAAIRASRMLCRDATTSPGSANPALTSASGMGCSHGTSGRAAASGASGAGGWSRWHDVREVLVPLMLGYGRLQPGGHGRAGDEGQHCLGRVVGQHSTYLALPRGPSEPGRNSGRRRDQASRDCRTRWSSSPRRNFRSCRWPPRGCPTGRSGSGSTSRTGRSNLICTGYSPNWGSPPAVSFPGCSGAAHRHLGSHRTPHFFSSQAGPSPSWNCRRSAGSPQRAGGIAQPRPRFPRPAGALLKPGFPIRRHRLPGHDAPACCRRW